MLFLRPAGGLCNRLKALKSAVGLTSVQRQRLVVFWRLDREMNASFGRLFQVPSVFQIRDGVQENILTKMLFSKHNLLMNIPEESGNVAERIKGKKLLPAALTAYRDFYDGAGMNYDWLRPVEVLQSQIDSVRKTFPRDIIGVHIRRTDNQAAIVNSPLSLFIEKMDSAVERNERQRFFVATDDENVKRSLRERYGKRIFAREGVPPRDSVDGVPQAVVDLFLLASCSRVYGSFGSTFSQEAAKIGKIEFEEIRKVDVGNL